MGDIPGHWHLRRLRSVAELRVSSIDKHVADGEEPVRLCNYVDVYKHDIIRPSMPFMRGTATGSEVERFRLQPNDVLITKDSETWNDIGVPALVAESADDLVSGYHLAMLRPTPELHGAYLFRALQSSAIVYQFHVEANGVTRYGLAHAAIKAVTIPLPPRDEQLAIVRFLDHADRKIRRYIRAKQKLIALLEEQKQAIIHRAVTRGLDPNVPLKPCGVPWLGDIPAHWEVRRAKYLFREVDERSKTGSEELLSVSHITGVTPRSQKNITMFKAASYAGHKLCQPGDLVVNTMWAWMGALGVSEHRGLISPAYAVYRPLRSADFAGIYLDGLLRSRPYLSNIICQSTGVRASRLRLYPEEFFKLTLVHPPIEEQEQIVAQILADASELEVTVSRLQREIELLREYRARLIADVVTGKVDVREAAAALPEHEDDVEPVDEADTDDGVAAGDEAEDTTDD